MQSTGRSRSLRNPLVFTLIVVLLPLLAAPPAGGTTVLRLAETELIDAATLVVVATCRGTATERSGRRLVTHAEVEVEQALKGHSRHNLTVVLPGGVDRDAVPPVAEVWPGAPTLVTGERALLFLRPGAERGTWTVVGYDQGKLAMPPTPEGDDDLARLVERVRRRASDAAGTEEEVAP